MVWSLEEDGLVLLWVAVGADFLDWLRPYLSDARVASLDPYRDNSLTPTEQSIWLGQLRRVDKNLRDDVLANIRGRERLPQDPRIRATVESTLTERELSKMPYRVVFNDLKALLECALEKGSMIRIHGD
jgi:hypothetical protein